LQRNEIQLRENKLNIMESDLVCVKEALEVKVNEIVSLKNEIGSLTDNARKQNQDHEMKLLELNSKNEEAEQEHQKEKMALDYIVDLLDTEISLKENENMYLNEMVLKGRTEIELLQKKMSEEVAVLENNMVKQKMKYETDLAEINKIMVCLKFPIYMYCMLILIFKYPHNINMLLGKGSSYFNPLRGIYIFYFVCFKELKLPYIHPGSSLNVIYLCGSII
jgi:hypothetical protein